MSALHRIFEAVHGLQHVLSFASSVCWHKHGQGQARSPGNCHCAWVGGTLHLSQHWNPCALNTSEGVILWIQSWHPDHLQSWNVSGGRLYSCYFQIHSCLTQVFQWSSDLEGGTFSMVLPATISDVVQPVFVQWGLDSLSCHIVLPWTGLHSGVNDHDSWSPFNSSNTYHIQFIPMRVDAVPQPKPRELIFVWTISDLLGSTFINQDSPKVSAAHKALQELLPGQGFGQGPRQSLPSSLSSSHKHSGVSVPNVLCITSLRPLKHTLGFFCRIAMGQGRKQDRGTEWGSWEKMIEKIQAD